MISQDYAHLPRESRLAIDEARRSARLAIEQAVHSMSSKIQKADRHRLAQKPAFKFLRSLCTLAPITCAIIYLKKHPENTDYELKAAGAAVGAFTLSQGARRLYNLYDLDARRIVIDAVYDAIATKFHEPLSEVAAMTWRLRTW
eukprot:CAMPEP_0197317456 /NCGR_PEP_ID=MMETSP0891-20130614/47145_1 /TAXON_ID=44058 ORGANISM="Aureoumbra lagunensis, Strain CCMP1510" /NCGR_SAMPLE_ID=MMETSP0891 /ASSEMBLY_ACC=CAM_ASM_000534 /LENGTH=143 /DNA_ID=CAMNT_0042807461 /DNA_START=529 /DNA_END=957 /DNA_ORIENTATION=-